MRHRLGGEGFFYILEGVISTKTVKQLLMFPSFGGTVKNPCFGAFWMLPSSAGRTTRGLGITWGLSYRLFPLSLSSSYESPTKTSRR